MCNPFDPTCIPGVIAGNIANSAIDQFVAKIGEGLNKLFELLATSWFNVPSPDVANSTVVRSLSGDLRWITIYIAIFGMLFGLGRMAWELKATPALTILRMIINLIAVSALGATIVAILVDAGDQFAPWVVSRATGEPFSSSTLTGLLNPATLQSNVAIGLIVGLLAMFGTLAQVIFMVVRGAMLIGAGGTPADDRSWNCDGRGHGPLQEDACPGLGLRLLQARRGDHLCGWPPADARRWTAATDEHDVRDDADHPCCVGVAGSDQVPCPRGCGWLEFPLLRWRCSGRGDRYGSCRRHARRQCRGRRRRRWRRRRCCRRRCWGRRRFRIWCGLRRPIWGRGCRVLQRRVWRLWQWQWQRWRGRERRRRGCHIRCFCGWSCVQLVER